MDHLVVGVVLYGGLLHRDSTIHLYSNQVLGMKWSFGLLLELEECQVSQEQQLHINVLSILINFILKSTPVYCFSLFHM